MSHCIVVLFLLSLFVNDFILDYCAGSESFQLFYNLTNQLLCTTITRQLPDITKHARLIT